MMNHNKNSSSIETMSVLLLYLLFSILVIFTFVAGIKAYHSVRNTNNNNYALRTTLQYVSNKAKAYRKIGAIDVTEIHGKDALVIKENLDGKLFNTYIYENEGKLCELFIEDNTSVDLSWGTPINNISGFDVNKISDKLIEIKSDSSIPLIISVS